MVMTALEHLRRDVRRTPQLAFLRQTRDGFAKLAGRYPQRADLPEAIRILDNEIARRVITPAQRRRFRRLLVASGARRA